MAPYRPRPGGPARLPRAEGAPGPPPLLATLPVQFDARRDEATGLPNGLAFLEDLETMARGRRPVGLLQLDIDELDEVNRRRGRAAGDTLIGVAADVLGARDDASAYRFSGDEFCLVTGPERASAVGREVVAAFRAAAARVGLPATWTAGCAQGAPPFDVADLLCRADAALTAGKGAGGDRLVVAMAGGDLGGQGRVVGKLVRRLVETLHQAQQWRYSALTDPVTGLPNHRYAREALRTAVAEAERSGGHAGVVFLDGDGLRRLNELSYEAGNGVIRRLGRLLLERTRPPDVLGRWFSGDEFLLVMPGARPARALEAARLLCDAVRRAAAGWEIPVTVSAGVAAYPEHGRDVDALLRAAYAACAAAKRLGKDRAVVADGAPPQAAEATAGP